MRKGLSESLGLESSDLGLGGHSVYALLASATYPRKRWFKDCVGSSKGFAGCHDGFPRFYSEFFSGDP